MKYPAAKDPEFESPFEVGNYLLKVTEQGITGRDEEAFLDRFALPLTIGTYQGEQVIETRAALLQVLRDVQDFLRLHNVDLIDRRTVQAQFVTPDKILAMHESRYLSKGLQIGEVKLCHGVLERFDGFWKITSNDYAVADAPGLNRALLGRARTEHTPAAGEQTHMKTKET